MEPKRRRPARSAVHELVLRLRRPPQPQPWFRGTRGRRRRLLLRVPQLRQRHGEPGLLGSMPGNPQRPNQLGATPLEPRVAPDYGEAECGRGGWGRVRVRVLARRHGSTGGSGAAEHSGLVSQSTAALQRQAGLGRRRCCFTTSCKRPVPGLKTLGPIIRGAAGGSAAGCARRGRLAACQIAGHISRFKSHCDLFGRTCQRLAGFPPLMKGAEDV